MKGFDIKRYSKLVAVLVGLVGLFLGPDMLGLVGNEEVVVELLLSLLTAFGVYQVTNQPMPTGVK